jgi:hypothetical protein
MAADESGGATSGAKLASRSAIVKAPSGRQSYIKKHDREELTESSSGRLQPFANCRHANRPPHFDLLIIATCGTFTTWGGPPPESLDETSRRRA